MSACHVMGPDRHRATQRLPTTT